MAVPEFFTKIFLGNSIADYSLALVVFFSCFLLLKIFKFFVIKKLEKLAQKTKNSVDDEIVKSLDSLGWPYYVIISIGIGLRFLNVTNIIEKVAYYLILLLTTYYVAKIVQQIIIAISQKYSEKNKKDNSAIISFIAVSAKIILWAVALILLLDNLGVKVTTLIAGLGIGGIAIAFALQNVLEDIFSSISIYFDKPFQVGDYIVIGKDSGTVERIGIKTTRIKTLQGEELVVSNQELTSTRVNNYKKMKKRRIAFSFGVVYGTTSSKMKKIPLMVKKIIDDLKECECDRVHFKEFADSSLQYEVVYYVNSQDYTMFMDVQQSINLGIKESFEKAKIEMAYPTQTVYVKK